LFVAYPSALERQLCIKFLILILVGCVRRRPLANEFARNANVAPIEEVQMTQVEYK